MDTVLMKRILLFIAVATILLGGTSFMESTGKLTEAEIQILVSTGASETRIRNGQLTSTEKQDIVVFREMEAQIAARYPEETICFTQMDVNASGGAGYGFKGYTQSKGTDELFDVFVQIDKDAGQTEYTIKDNLIGLIMRDDFTAYMAQLLEALKVPFEEISASIPYLADAEFDRSMSAGEHIAAGDMLPCSVMITLNAGNMSEESFQAAGNRIEEAVRAAGLTGSVYLIGSDAKAGAQPWESILYRRQILL